MYQTPILFYLAGGNSGAGQDALEPVGRPSRPDDRTEKAEAANRTFEQRPQLAQPRSSRPREDLKLTRGVENWSKIELNRKKHFIKKFLKRL